MMGKDTVTGKFSFDGKLVKFSFPRKQRNGWKNTRFRLSGVNNDGRWQGNW